MSVHLSNRVSFPFTTNIKIDQLILPFYRAYKFLLIQMLGQHTMSNFGQKNKFCALFLVAIGSDLKCVINAKIRGKLV